MKKNILHIISSTQWRGGEQQVDYLLNGEYNDTSVFLFCPKGAVLQQKNIKKTTPIFTYKKKFGVDIVAAWQLKKICKQQKINILHLHDSHSINTFILATFLGLKIPVVVHRHVNFPITSLWKYKNQSIKKFIAVSAAIKNSLSNFINPSIIDVIHPCIDVVKFSKEKKGFLRQEIAVAKNSKLIGIVAAIEQEKNIESFLNIATYYNKQKSDYQFIVIGEGSLLNTLKQQYDIPTIHFLGFRKDVEKILPDLDAFIFTSKNEGFGLVILEAMAAGVPVISNQYPAVKEIIQHGINGFITTNEKEIIKQLDIILENETLKNTVVKNARNFVQQFDIPQMINKIEKVYHQL